MHTKHIPVVYLSIYPFFLLMMMMMFSWFLLLLLLWVIGRCGCGCFVLKNQWMWTKKKFEKKKKQSLKHNIHWIENKSNRLICRWHWFCIFFFISFSMYRYQKQIHAIMIDQIVFFYSILNIDFYRTGNPKEMAKRWCFFYCVNFLSIQKKCFFFVFIHHKSHWF